VEFAPEPIILGLEYTYAKYAPGGDLDYFLDHIEHICKAAGNQNCLDTIKQVKVREWAGIKPMELKLKEVPSEEGKIVDTGFKWEWEKPQKEV
jgi:hypothetical protein